MTTKKDNDKVDKLFKEVRIKDRPFRTWLNNAWEREIKNCAKTIHISKY